MSMDADKLQRIHFIKQSLPFSKLSHKRLEWLAEQVETIVVPPGTVIFNQGQIGDRCYLICKGRVEIITHENNEERQLAILKSPTVFGEATIINKSPRNATARALEECELLVIQHTHLLELIETEKNVAEMFMMLMVDRSRPARNANITVHPRTTVDGQDIVVLKNATRGTYFKLSMEGWFVWQQLNGKQTLQEITMSLAEKFNLFAPHVVVSLISKLGKAGFIHNVTTHIEQNRADLPFFQKWLVLVRPFLQLRFALANTDKWLSLLYDKIGYLLFTRLAFALFAILAFAGLFGFIFATHHIIYLFRTIHDSWMLLVLLMPFTLLAVALHELAHALATKFFGHEVRYMGVGWNWFRPIAFTDTSDMWLSTRWPRIAVNLAGAASDVIIAGFASLCILLVVNPYVQCFLWLFALYIYLNAFRTLSPLQEQDGYFILMDIFDRPRLRYFSVAFLLKDAGLLLQEPQLLKKYQAEICYWLACVIYLVLVSLVILYVQSIFFKVLGLNVNLLFDLIIPFIVVIATSVSMYIDIKKERD